MRFINRCNVAACTVGLLAFIVAGPGIWMLQAQPATRPATQPVTRPAVPPFVPGADTEPAPMELRPNRGLNILRNTEADPDGKWSDLTNNFLSWGNITQPWNAQPGLMLTANGYPLSDAGAFSYLRGYPKLTCKFSMRGSGTVTFAGRLRALTPLVRDAQGVLRGDVEIDPLRSTNAMVRIANIDPANPPDDMRIIAPDAGGESGTYREPYLWHTRQAVALRMMDFTQMNANATRFGNRVRPEHWNQVSEQLGVAWEYAIDLANDSDADIWINVPDRYTVDDMRELARMLATRLKPGRKVYVEFSNEDWNNIFTQYPRNVADANANPELNGTGLDRLWQHVAFKAVQCGDVFRQEFAAAGREQGDIRNILAGQAANPYILEVGLKYLKARHGDVRSRVWGLSIARYWNPPDDFDWVTTTQTVRFPEYSQTEWSNAYAVETLRSIRNPGTKYSQFRALANAYGLVPVAYEGGFGMEARNGIARRYLNTQAKIAMQSNPLMEQVTIAGMNAAARDVGPALFMQFGAFSNWDNYYWGLKNQAEPDKPTPKWTGFIRGSKRDPASIPAPAWNGERLISDWTPGGVWATPVSVNAPPVVVLPLPAPATQPAPVGRKIRRIIIEFTDGSTEEMAHFLQ